MNSQLVQQLVDQLGFKLGANRLPYEVPIHPNLVHFTLGLFIIAILFDIAGNLFPLERPILKFLAVPALRSGFYDVGWYNLVASAIVTFFTVAAGFFEIMLADPPANVKSAWGLGAAPTMLLHGLGGVLLLGAIVALTVWRGFQRYRWRKEASRQVQWSYLLAGVVMLGLLFVHGTLGAHMGDQFGIHNTAAGLLRQGLNPSSALQ
ncbi:MULTISPECIES: DUF2231 domain-containing protein [unclassified Microcoleus]|uniref:DUF2231 domain-containing protein n=1 Tax=unclassified Microcoleus TaxID=2642155 RepID=UPI002FD733E9